MNEENEEKKEMEAENFEKGTTKKVGEKTAIAVMTALFLSLSIGFIMGILFAPKKGQQTRKEITDKSGELYEKSKKICEDAFGKTKDLTKESRDKFVKIKDIIAPKKREQEKEKKEEHKD